MPGDVRTTAFLRLGQGRYGKIDVPGWAAVLADMFAKQRRFASDREQGACARAGRAAGKSTGVARRFHRVSASHPAMSSVFITQSVERSRDIMLPALLDLDRKFRIGLREHKGDNCVYWPNDYRVLFRGCKDRHEANKRRGTPWVMAHWDEADTIPSALLEYDIHECVEPRLMDVDGRWSISGTPGPIPDGYWHKLSTQPGVHEWDARDNPHIQGGALKYFLKVLERLGATKGPLRLRWPPGATLESIIDNPELHYLLPPKFVREYLGKWVTDTAALIYQLTQANTYVGGIPTPDRITIGVDLGGATRDKPDLDRCAVTVAQSCNNLPFIWIPESFSKSDATVQTLAAMLYQLIEKYPGAHVELDAASAGTVILNSFRAMGIPVMPATKGPKLRRIQLVQGMIQNGNLQVSRMWHKQREQIACQDLIEESTALVWADSRKDHHPRCKDDVWDSLLYAVIPHLGDHEEELDPPKAGSAEAIQSEEDAEFEEALREAQENRVRVYSLPQLRLMTQALKLAA